MMNRRKHAEVIKKWADGAEVETRHSDDEPWLLTSDPGWFDSFQYRAVTPPKIIYAHVHKVGHESAEISMSDIRNWNDIKTTPFTDICNVKFTFDGETGNLKSVEMIK